MLHFVTQKNTGFYFDSIDTRSPGFIEADKDEYSDKDIIEYSEESIKFSDAISEKILKNNGVAIIIDYGYINFASGDSLQSIYKHKFNDVFKNLGNADLTSHVNFRLLYAAFKNKGVKEVYIQNQGDFLKSLGIVERGKFLAKNLSSEKENDLFLRINRLTNRNGMGDLFKCLIVENF